MRPALISSGDQGLDPAIFPHRLSAVNIVRVISRSKASYLASCSAVHFVLSGSFAIADSAWPLSKMRWCFTCLWSSSMYAATRQGWFVDNMRFRGYRVIVGNRN